MLSVNRIKWNLQFWVQNLVFTGDFAIRTYKEEILEDYIFCLCVWNYIRCDFCTFSEWSSTQLSQRTQTCPWLLRIPISYASVSQVGHSLFFREKSWMTTMYHSLVTESVSEWHPHWLRVTVRLTESVTVSLSDTDLSDCECDRGRGSQSLSQSWLNQSLTETISDWVTVSVTGHSHTPDTSTHSHTHSLTGHSLPVSHSQWQSVSHNHRLVIES